MSDFGVLLSRTMREPLAWIGAAAVALIGAEQPADWIARSLARDVFRVPTLLDALAGYKAPEAFGIWLGTVALASICRLPLVAATLVAAQPSARAPAMTLVLKNAGRLFRTRNIGVMVTCAFAFIPASLLFGWRKHTTLSFLPDIGIALLLALAASWVTLGDRFALARFDARQDAIARKAIDDAHNAPYYLDTGKARRGHGVATGADNAVTAAGWALLDKRAFAVVGITLLMELGRAAGVALAPAAVPSIAVRTVLGTVTALVSAVLWTRVFLARDR
jgi:hypothetical protein